MLELRPGPPRLRWGVRPSGPGTRGRLVARRVMAAVVVAALLRSLVVETYRAPDDTMAPQVSAGDVVLVEKVSTTLTDLGHGDVVLVRPPNDWVARTPATSFAGRLGMLALGRDDDPLVMLRVVGLPGDSVEGRSDGSVIVNGVPIHQATSSPPATGGRSFRIVVPFDRLWLMSDNRAAGVDSIAHLDDVWGGTVPASSVRGAVTLVGWPPQHLHVVHPPEGVKNA